MQRLGHRIAARLDARFGTDKQQDAKAPTAA
jgi:hypothetical protein